MSDRRAKERIERMKTRTTDISVAERNRRFMQIDLLEFIRNQRLSVWWNTDARNEKLSTAFKSLMLSLVADKCDDAIKHRRELANNCTPWLLCCKSFMRLAYVEYAYFCEATGKRMVDSATILTVLGVSKRKSKAFFNAIHNRLCKSKIVAKAYSAFLEFKNREVSYYDLPIRNCAVCATMGAGKSTFINALLGSDVLPARCEVTTAKITSVYDRDGETRIRGFAQLKRGFDGDCADVSLKQLNTWNDNKNVSRVFLQGDFDGIRNNGMVVAIHDTPGANNSLDPTHHKTTIGFLAQNRMDLLIFILNAEQPRTTDEFALLNEIMKKVVKPHGTRILFVLNKADSIDPEKESLQKALDDYRDFLSRLGYKEPIILPAASKSARLLKLVKLGQESRLTVRERHIDLAMILEPYKGSCDFDLLLEKTGLPNIERRIENKLPTLTLN